MKKIFIFLNIIISITFLSSCYADDMHIKFAMEATYPPFESIDTDGNIIGFDIDIANNICKKINAKCSFINAPWDSLIPGLKLGKFNAIISALAITSERAKQVAFSQAYYFDTASFVGSKINPIETTSAGLLGKSIGVQGGTAMENYMRGFYSDKKINVKAYPRIMDAFLDLKSGRIDAVLADTPIAKNWISQPKNSEYMIIAQPIQNPKYFGSGLGIAVKHNNTQLLNLINKGLNEIKADGTYDQLIAKYFGK